MARQSIGEFLATLRKAHGFTQQEVADRLDVSNRTVSAWECNSALPDILLLPAIAELYGVTADEILAGARKQDGANTEMALSERSERKLLKRKLAKFTTQASLLGGLLALGLLFFFLGWFTVTVMWSGWEWWLILLFAGLALSVVSLTCLIAGFRGAETSADEELPNYGNYVVLLRRKLSFALCVPALVPFGFFVLSIIAILAGTIFSVPLLSAAAFAVTFVLLLFGILLPSAAVKTYGGEKAVPIQARNKKLYQKTALFGLIPCVAALALAITLSFVNITTRDLLYSADRENFKSYMESAEVGGKEYSVPLSELSKGLGTGVEYEKQYLYGEHITYCFYHGYCTVQISEGDLGEEITAERLTAEDGFFVYNLRKGMGDVTFGGNTVLGNYYAIRTEGDKAFYERVFVENFRTLGWALGGTLILADGAVCALVCLIKREKYVVTL